MIVEPRQLALDALNRIELEGAFSNVLLPKMLAISQLDSRDRNFVTELVYGSTRMQRACDFLVDRFMAKDPDAKTRTVLRLGAYQLAFMRTPTHAAVSATVELAPQRTRGLVNAVLRKVANNIPETAADWPSLAVHLSYPDWIVNRLVADLGSDAATAALEAMNAPASRTERDDGYTQDLGSQWVVDLVGAQTGELIADVCAAPGGKATGMAGTDAVVLASDLHRSRVRLLAGNIERVASDRVVPVVVANGTALPYADRSLDRILVDAPCSGLGALRRRPDARWRITSDAIETLSDLQRRLLDEACRVVKVGGTVVYSVCTVTNAETIDIDAWMGETHPNLVPIERAGEPWIPQGRGAIILPQTADTDGMAIFRYLCQP